MSNPTREIFIPKLEVEVKEEEEEEMDGEEDSGSDLQEGDPLQLSSTLDELPIHLGDEFSTLDELKEAMELLQKKQNILYYKRYSRTIKSGQKKIKTKLNPNLKYYEIKWACQRAFRNYGNTSGRGLPKRRRIPPGECRAFVKVCVTKDAQRFLVTKANFIHNHSSIPTIPIHDTINVPINLENVQHAENPSQMQVQSEPDSLKEMKRRKRKEFSDSEQLGSQEGDGLLHSPHSSSSPHRHHHPDRHDIFGQFVASEMRHIEDPVIYQHTKRAIQDALSDAQEEILLLEAERRIHR